MNSNVPKVVEQLTGNSDAAAILLDSRGTPVSIADEALRVLLYPVEVPRNGRARRLAADRIQAFFPAGPLSGETPSTGEILSGRRSYRYRICRLEKNSQGNPAAAAVILLERNRSALDPAAASLAGYRLTAREEQVVRLVLRGLSNKQIAVEMGISPNTVKVFLRLVMTKMGVGNRFGILGKLLARASSHTRPTAPAAAAPIARFSVVRNA